MFPINHITITKSINMHNIDSFVFNERVKNIKTGKKQYITTREKYFKVLLYSNILLPTIFLFYACI